MNDSNINLRTISQKYFGKTKRWWSVVWILKLLAFVVGAAAMIWPGADFTVTLITAIFVLGSEFADWISSYYRERAETLLRKLDLFDSFGWEIRSTEIADEYIGLSKKTRAKLTQNTGLYFASKEGVGSKRALQNLQESAWWSKHLAGNMRLIIWILAALMIAGSLFTLIISSQLITSTEQVSTISRIVISILLLGASLRLLPLASNYGSFRNRAKDIENQACELLSKGDFDDVQAVKAFNEYHLARASSPLLPEYLWKLRRDSLNEAWDIYVGKS